MQCEKDHKNVSNESVRRCSTIWLLLQRSSFGRLESGTLLYRWYTFHSHGALCFLLLMRKAKKWTHYRYPSFPKYTICGYSTLEWIGNFYVQLDRCRDNFVKWGYIHPSHTHCVCGSVTQSISLSCTDRGYLLGLWSWANKLSVVIVFVIDSATRKRQVASHRWHYGEAFVCCQDKSIFFCFMSILKNSNSNIFISYIHP